MIVAAALGLTGCAVQWTPGEMDELYSGCTGAGLPSESCQCVVDTITSETGYADFTQRSTAEQSDAFVAALLDC